jgi:hypothetical protein
LSLTATLFRYDVHDPAVVDRATYTLATLGEPTITTGLETVATSAARRSASLALTPTCTRVRGSAAAEPTFR